MKTIKQDGIWFRGQYAEALERLLKGNVITMRDFNNGTWEPTSQIARFIGLLNYTKLELEISGESLRQKEIRIKNK